MVRVAINGFGRIGRLLFRAGFDQEGIEFVAVNDLTSPPILAHLLKYDSVHGKFPGKIKVDGEYLRAGKHEVKVLSERDPAKLPWKDLNVDVVIESTGFFRTRDAAGRHLEAGAKRVLISAPAADPDITIVYGVNHDDFDHENHKIVSGASCTTNCLVPVVKVLDDSFGVGSALMTTVHAVTNDQSLLDYQKSDLRRARSGILSLIPTTTGAAKATTLVLPHLEGRIDGMAMRAPTADVSVVDLVVTLEKNPSLDDVKQALREAADNSLQGILGYSDEPLVSVDFTGDRRSSIVDMLACQKSGDLYKILSWYDNEIGYSARMIDLVKLIAS
ncbi:MAG: type I glyceraldehyde-3-phosphate dehydrogenase [Candidatus Heimdallarchaeota archaeon]